MFSKLEELLLVRKVYYWTIIMFMIIFISSIVLLSNNMLKTFVSNNLYLAILYLAGLVFFIIADKIAENNDNEKE